LTLDTHTGVPPGALAPSLLGVRARPRPRVSVAVMADPRRAPLVGPLLDDLDRPAAVAWDQRHDRWHTGRRALLAAHPSATHHVVVQDDAIVCPDLCAGAEAVLEHVPPGRPVGLYLGSRQPHHALTARLYRQAQAAGHSFVVFGVSPMWGVAVVIPTEHIADLVAFGDRQSTRSYDGRLKRWYQHVRVDQWYPVPSLVDHRTDGPSLVGAGRRNQPNRVAFEFLGRGRSPLDVDWSTGATFDRSTWVVRGRGQIRTDDLRRMKPTS
jgi:hypothetical protein